MEKQQKIAIAGIILVAVLLISFIVGNSGSTDTSSEGKGAASQSAPKEEGAEAGHKDEPDSVDMSDEQAKAAGIVLDVVKQAQITSTLTLPGEIRFNQDRTAHIVPRVDGIVESVNADIGQQVKKDQLLAVIASTAISELRSDAMAAQKRLVLAKTTFEREKELWLEKISAEQDYLQAQQGLQEAEINVQNANQKLQALGTSASSRGGLNRYELRAPFSGLIVERHITLGESTQSNINVMTLADLSSVWAEIVVSAKDLNVVKLGTQVTVKAASLDSQSTGVVSFVGSLLGEQTRTATARVTLQNPDAAWRPGLFVNVEIVAGEASVPMAVAVEAIQSLEGNDVVFVKTSGGFKAVPVKTGRTDGKQIEIIDGLKPDTAYVSRGSFVLKSELGKESAEHEH